MVLYAPVELCVAEYSILRATQTSMLHKSQAHDGPAYIVLRLDFLNLSIS